MSQDAMEGTLYLVLTPEPGYAAAHVKVAMVTESGELPRGTVSLFAYDEKRITFSKQEWERFVADVKDGLYDI